MGTLTREKVTPGVVIPSQYVRIRKGKGIDSRFTLFSFVDNDTKQHIVFCPAFNLSGYGNTSKRANQMFDFNLDQFYTNLYKLSPQKMNGELVKLGWKQDKFKNKNYSSTFVGIDGELHNFNIEEGTLKFQTLTVAAE